MSLLCLNESPPGVLKWLPEWQKTSWCRNSRLVVCQEKRKKKRNYRRRRWLSHPDTTRPVKERMKKKKNFNNKPVNTPIWIPRSHNCLNSPPLAIVIITDTLLRDSISSINQSHTHTHLQPPHHISSICPIISLTRSKIPLLLQEGNCERLRAVQVCVCVCA